MHVRVRLVVKGSSVTIPTSRTTTIKELTKLIEYEFHIKPENQRLYFAGKQLENQYRLFDYGININDVIQLTVRETTNENISQKDSVFKNNKTENCTQSSLSNSNSSPPKDDLENISVESKYFKIGDYVDVKDYHYGSWFLGKLIKIKKDVSSVNVPDSPHGSLENDGLIYIVEFEGCSDEPPIEVQLQQIRLHSSEILPSTEVKVGDKVLMNYNVDHPKERGYWYDVLVKEIKNTRKGFNITGDVTIGIDNAVLSNCHMVFLNDIFIIKPYKLLAERTPEFDKIIQTKPTTIRACALSCIKCKDDENKLCKHCGCWICGEKNNSNEQLLCDECDKAYHMECLTPPLETIPEGDWYCPTCKIDKNEIVNAGEQLKTSKKKNLASTSKRDWGRGMACVARTKQCNIVPPNHFGPIPGIEVGTTWMFRVQVSESGVHRPPVGGIHGRDNEGAFSIVLSGRYEGDIDNGDQFLYSGSGGRDLSGNKRTGDQTHNQELTRYNRALALNCNAKIDDVNGATSKDWKGGKPIRVVRNYKLKKHSEFAPELGNRYDGIYKVVKYYPETGKSGFIVWRYVLRRDDPIPSPWSTEGKMRISNLDLKIIYPENYISDTMANKKKLSDSKRQLQEDNGQCEDKNVTNDSLKSVDKECEKKKVKIHYVLEKEAEKLIAADVNNKKYWDDCKELLVKGKKAFLDRVEETFSCICCQEVVSDPVTTKCFHNICKGCLKRSLNANVYQCPSCRLEFGKNFPLNINVNLLEILLYFFPGYNANR